MKVLIIFLSLVWVSCVTANTRDLSAINPQTEPVDQSEATSEPPLLLVDDYPDCMIDCTENGGSVKGCHCTCGWDTGGCNKIETPIKPLMLAGFDECVQTCVADGYCGPSGENCDDACRNACK